VKLEAGNYEQAKSLFYRGIGNTEIFKDVTPEIGKAINYLGLSKVFRHLNKRDSSYFYGVKSLTLLKDIKEISAVKIDLASAYENMFAHFQKFQKSDSAYKYLDLAYKERTRLNNKTISNLAAFQQSLLKKQLALKDLERGKIEIQSRTRTYILTAILLVFILFGAVLFYYYQQKKKANILLASQKEEIQSTLTQLRSTQSQLIQSEKMASLGELTAGIAHEIQNPLNFVNNFSEVNTELIKEIQDERRKTQDQRDEKLEDELLQDIVKNQEKINHHGKRAADIVKGMLQHSRSSSGVKEPTDINSLADEYLRLAYHGLRAKDKSFNATMKTDFDESIGSINIIPQDIGRVILNLITNAFYVVNEKSKQGITGYEPTVSVSTENDGNKVLISVKDNGNGIPDSIKEKIFQPFFTTKPTGQGTGLGLSMSYDIVKAHGGELKVETQEGEGSEFLIQLPTL
jgi:two-component system, NtrC family, sensor kinase